MALPCRAPRRFPLRLLAALLAGAAARGASGEYIADTRAAQLALPPGPSASAPRTTESDLADEDSDHLPFLKIEGSEARIGLWKGRAGNNLGQLVGVLVACQLLNLTALNFPPPKPDLVKILRLPADNRLRVVPDPGLFSVAKCRRSGSVGQPDCLGLRKRHYRAAAAAHLVPLLREELLGSCPENDNGLVIHMRSGDLLTEVRHQQSKFAPCSFFDQVIQQNRFDNVAIVTEPDMKHPCINVTQQRNPRVRFTVSSESFLHDACMLLRAKNVAYGARSSLSFMLAEVLSSSLEKVFLAKVPPEGPWECNCPVAEPSRDQRIGFVFGSEAQCAPGFEIATQQACREAAGALRWRMPDAAYNDGRHPHGCFVSHTDTSVYWNSYTGRHVANKSKNIEPLCLKHEGMAAASYSGPEVTTACYTIQDFPKLPGSRVKEDFMKSHPASKVTRAATCPLQDEYWPCGPGRMYLF